MRRIRTALLVTIVATGLLAPTALQGSASAASNSQCTAAREDVRDAVAKKERIRQRLREARREDARRTRIHRLQRKLADARSSVREARRDKGRACRSNVTPVVSKAENPPTDGAPGPASTGVPTGVQLTRFNGNLTITRPGTVVDGLDIRGYVEVRAPNVTIRRTIVRGSPDGPGSRNRDLVRATHDRAANLMILDSQLIADVASPRQAHGVDGWSYTLLRTEVSGTVDGAQIHRPGPVDVTIASSWFHDFRTFASDPNQNGSKSHNDGVQIQSGTARIRIVGNSISGADNAAIQVTQDNGDVRNVEVLGNWLDGGGCTVNLTHKPRSGLRGVTVADNQFGRATRNPNCGIIATKATQLSAPRNTWIADGTSVTVRNGG